MGHHRAAHPGKTNTPLQGITPKQAKPTAAQARAAKLKALKEAIKAAHDAQPFVNAPADPAADALKTQAYLKTGTFDRAKLSTAFVTHFAKAPRFKASEVPNLIQLVSFMEGDATVTDIRWMAYMLATAYWETGVIVKEKVPTKDKKGKQVLDKKGLPMTHEVKKWITMSPVEESGHGAGRAYYLPAKVLSLPSGEVQVTEYDGDQFTVKATGAYTPAAKKAKPGADAKAPAKPAYDADTGTPHSYFGRGYVQLTWWYNYATAGVQTGKGLGLLLDPDLVKLPENAYKVMSHGMVTGQGFANGHKLSAYIHGQVCDYIEARKMVNGADYATYIPISQLAVLFERVLLDAKP